MTLHTFLNQVLKFYEPLDCIVQALPSDRESELDYLPSDLQLLIIRISSKDLIEEIEVAYDNNPTAEIYAILTWELTLLDGLEYRVKTEPTLTNYYSGYESISNLVLESKHQAKQTENQILE